MRFGALLLATAAAAAPTHPHLAVPSTISSLATPIWHPSGLKAEYVLAQSPPFHAPAAVNAPVTIGSAVAFVTAQQSPLCAPDLRLGRSDFGACVPHGGTSQTKLLHNCV